MAVGRITVFDQALRKIGSSINLETDAFKLVLTTKAQLITAAFIGASENGRYSDLTAEVTGTGYTAGGKALTAVTWTRAGAIVSFKADPVVWEALTATAKYAVLYRDGATKELIAFFDLDDANADGRVVSAADFVVNWADGLFTLTRAA